MKKHVDSQHPHSLNGQYAFKSHLYTMQTVTKQYGGNNLHVVLRRDRMKKAGLPPPRDFIIQEVS